MSADPTLPLFRRRAGAWAASLAVGVLALTGCASTVAGSAVAPFGLVAPVASADVPASPVGTANLPSLGTVLPSGSPALPSTFPQPSSVPLPSDPIGLPSTFSVPTLSGVPTLLPPTTDQPVPTTDSTPSTTTTSTSTSSSDRTPTVSTPAPTIASPPRTTAPSTTNSTAATLNCRQPVITVAKAPFCFTAPAGFADSTKGSSYPATVEFKTSVSLNPAPADSDSDLIFVVAQTLPGDSDKLDTLAIQQALQAEFDKGVAGAISVGKVKSLQVDGHRAFESDIALSGGVAKRYILIFDKYSRTDVSCQYKAHQKQILAGCTSVLGSVQIVAE